jgi:hypothetical protein
MSETGSHRSRHNSYNRDRDINLAADIQKIRQEIDSQKVKGEQNSYWQQQSEPIN